MGWASAAMMISSVIPLFNVLVASLAPFLICLRVVAYCSKSMILVLSCVSANGVALGLMEIMIQYVIALVSKYCLSK